MPVHFSGAVEGDLDEAVFRRLAGHVGAQVSSVYGRSGKQGLKASINGFNAAAEHSPWVVLVDLDRDHPCAPALSREWLANPARLMCFRVAVVEVEAWLLADTETIARYLGVSRARIPRDPEALPDPKQTLVNVAARSSKRDIREAVPPEPGSGRSVGVLYNPLMGVYARDHWRPALAADRCDSLRRCLNKLEALRLLAEADPPHQG